MGAEPAGRCRILRPREVAMMGASVLATRSIVPRLSGSWSTMSPRKMTRGSCPRRARRPSTADGAAGLGNHPGSRPLVPLLISPSGQRSDGSMDSWKRSRPDHQGRVHPAGGGEGGRTPMPTISPSCPSAEDSLEAQGTRWLLMWSSACRRFPRLRGGGWEPACGTIRRRSGMLPGTCHCKDHVYHPCVPLGRHETYVEPGFKVNAWF
jgi:hypothetical protein